MYTYTHTQVKYRYVYIHIYMHICVCTHICEHINFHICIVLKGKEYLNDQITQWIAASWAHPFSHQWPKLYTFYMVRWCIPEVRPVIRQWFDSKSGSALKWLDLLILVPEIEPSLRRLKQGVQWNLTKLKYNLRSEIIIFRNKVFIYQDISWTFTHIQTHMHTNTHIYILQITTKQYLLCQTYKPTAF